MTAGFGAGIIKHSHRDRPIPRPCALVTLLIVLAPALAAPQLRPEKPKARSLVGTTWTGNTFEMQTMVLEFRAEGQVSVTYNGNPVADCAWKQDGEIVYFAINKAYLEFDGKLAGDRITGRCHNIAGTQWDVVLTPVKDR